MYVADSPLSAHRNGGLCTTDGGAQGGLRPRGLTSAILPPGPLRTQMIRCVGRALWRILVTSGLMLPPAVIMDTSRALPTIFQRRGLVDSAFPTREHTQHSR